MKDELRVFPEPFVFVFGSNLAGIHGAGAAAFARKYYGAELGKGDGLYGRSYAIPTKDERLESLPLAKIRFYVSVFLDCAMLMQSTIFLVTPIGTGLAGYKRSEIASMFTTQRKPLPNNLVFSKEWFDPR